MTNFKASIRNSTFHGNTSDWPCGGGIYIGKNGGEFSPPDQIQLSFITVTGNISDHDCTSVGGSNCSSNNPGGGICVSDSVAGSAPVVLMKSSVVAENRYGRTPIFQRYANFSAGNYTSSGHNFIGHVGPSTHGFSNGVSYDQVGGKTPLNPKLKELAENGGPTLTRMPESGSPLINAGGAATDIAGMSLATDQRGRARFKSSAADIGAVESSSMHCFPIRKVDGGIGIICF